MAEPVGRGFIELVPDTAKLDQSIGGLGSKLGGKFGKLGESLGGKLDGGLSGVLGKVSALGPQGALAVAAVGGAVAIGAALYKVGSDFNDSYNKIKKQTGATGAEFDKLRDSFKNVAKSTGASFDDISTAVAGVSQRTGATGKDLETLSLSMLKLSSITGTDLNANIEKASGLFNGWKIETADMPKYLDKLLVASQKSGVGVDALMAAAEKSGPIMRQFNFSFDESVALLAAFDKAGLDSATATVALNTALKSQQKMVEKQAKAVDSASKQYEKLQEAQAKKPSPEGKKALDEAYKNVMELTGALEAMQDASPAEFLENTVMKIKDLDQAAGNQEAIQVFGSKAGPKLAEAIRAGTISMSELVEAMGDADGAINKTAKETATIGGTFKKMGNQIKVAIEPLAYGLFKGLENAFKAIAPYISSFIALVADVLGVLASLISWVTKCKPVMIALGVAVGILAVAFLALNAPVVLIIGAILVITTVIKNLWETNEGFRNAITGIWNAVVLVFTSPVDIIKGAISLISDAIGWVIDVAKSVLSWVTDNWPLLAQILIAIFLPGGIIIAAIWHFRDEISEVIGQIFDWFKALPGKVLDALAGFGNLLKGWVVDAWDLLMSGLGSSSSDFVDWFKKLPGQVLDALGDLGGKLLGWVKSGFDYVTSGIGGAAGGVLDFFSDLPGQVVGKVGDLGGALAGAAGGFISDVGGDALDAGKKFLGYFSGLPDEVIKKLKPLGGKLTGWITDAFKTLVSVLGSAAKGFFDWFLGVPKKVVANLGNVGKEVSKWVTDLVNSMIAGLTGKAGGLVDAVKDIPAKILGALSGLGTDLGDIGRKAIGAMSNAMRDASSWVVDVVKEIPGKIKNAVGDAASWLLSKGRDVVQGLINGIRNMWETLKALIRGAGGIVLGAMGDAKAILFNKGRDIVDGLIRGVRNMWESLKAVVRGAGGIVLGAIGNARDWLKSKGEDVIKGLWDGIKGMRGWIAGTFKIGAWVWNAIGNAKAWLVESGKNVIRGLWDGIEAMRGWIMGKMRGLLDGLKKLLPFSPPKDPTSPFAGRGQPVYSGLSIGRQLAEGMERATPLISAAAAGMLEAADLRPKLYDLSVVGGAMAAELAGAGIGAAQVEAGGDTYQLVMNVSEADTSQMQAGFRRLELLSGAA